MRLLIWKPLTSFDVRSFEHDVHPEPTPSIHPSITDTDSMLLVCYPVYKSALTDPLNFNTVPVIIRLRLVKLISAEWTSSVAYLSSNLGASCQLMALHGEGIIGTNGKSTQVKEVKAVTQQCKQVLNMRLKMEIPIPI